MLVNSAKDIRSGDIKGPNGTKATPNDVSDVLVKWSAQSVDAHFAALDLKGADFYEPWKRADIGGDHKFFSDPPAGRNVAVIPLYDVAKDRDGAAALAKDLGSPVRHRHLNADAIHATKGNKTPELFAKAMTKVFEDAGFEVHDISAKPKLNTSVLYAVVSDPAWSAS